MTVNTEYEKFELKSLLISGWEIFKTNLFSFLFVIMLFSGPDWITNLISKNFDKQDHIPLLLIAVVSSIFYNLEFMIIGAFTNQVVSGEQGTIFPALKKAIDHFIPATYACVIEIVAIILGIFALILPGLYLSVKFTFTPLAVVLRDKGPIGALKYSSALVKNRWWNTFSYVFCFSILLSFSRLLSGLITIVNPKSTSLNILGYCTEQLFVVFGIILVSLLFMQWDSDLNNETEAI